MSLNITIEISVAPGEQYTTLEADVVKALAGIKPDAPSLKETVAAAAPAAAEAPAAPTAKRGPGRPPKAEKPAPAPTSPQSTQAAVLDTTIDEEPEEAEVEVEEVEAEVEEDDEDLVGGGDATAYTKEDAIAKATQLISGQKMALVKAALAKVGAKKVSDLEDAAAIQTFMAELEK